MTIELYVFPPSPRSFKVMAIANHLGLDWTLQFVDLPKGDQKTPQYTALNPNMRAPTLTDGDYVLWESNAIAQYLASKRPESGLMPRDERGRLDVTRWQFWDLAHWDPAQATVIFEYVAKPFIVKGGEPDLAAVAKATELFHRAAKVLDAQLRNRKFVTGDTLTLADFSLGAPLNYAEMGHYPLEPYSEIKRWYGALSAMPAWHKTLAQSPLLAAPAA
ncbi:MAG: glutathione S-transferase family protein [Methylocella sp.]